MTLCILRKPVCVEFELETGRMKISHIVNNQDKSVMNAYIGFLFFLKFRPIINCNVSWSNKSVLASIHMSYQQLMKNFIQLSRKSRKQIEAALFKTVPIIRHVFTITSMQMEKCRPTVPMCYTELNWFIASPKQKRYLVANGADSDIYQFYNTKGEISLLIFSYISENYVSCKRILT
jgi:hypothetical protein